VIERQSFAFVEDRQVVAGVARHPDHIGHWQQAAPPVSPLPVAASSSARVVVMMIDAGSPLCCPVLPRPATHAAPHSTHRGCVGRGCANRDQSPPATVRRPPPRCRRRGCTCRGPVWPAWLPGWRATRGLPSHATPTCHRRAVYQRQATAPGPVLVGVGPVGIQPIGESISELGELLGSIVGALARQIGFGLRARGASTKPGNCWKKRRITRPDPFEFPVALGGGRRGQHRRQRFTGQAVRGPGRRRHGRAGWPRRG